MKTADREAPTRPLPTRSQRGRRRRTWRRVLLIASMLVALVLVAVAVSVFAYLRVQFNQVAEVSKPIQQATHLLKAPVPGRPTIALLIGSDLRPTKDEEFGRSDTLMLVRVDPVEEVISTMSIPRSTQVDIPGLGPDLINAAYSYGGPELALQTVTQLTGLPVNYLVVVGFDGFKDVIDAFGGLYLDIDHRYFYDGPGGYGGFEPIDLQPGYQLLSGEEALAFARDRHADSDYFRIARQQMVVHELRRLADQVAGSPYHVFTHFSKVLSLVRAVAGSTDVGAPEGKLKFSSAVNWARTIQGIPESRMVSVPLTDSDPESIQAALHKFMNPVKRTPKVPPVRIGESPGSSTPGQGSGTLANASVTPDPEWVQAEFRALESDPGFPVLFPTVREVDSDLSDAVRTYGVDTGSGDEPALRATFSVGNGLEFWGIQETTWTDAPILEDPSRTESFEGREYRYYFNGGRLHMVAFQENGTVYWVSNTLFDRLSNATMVAIARSLRPV